MGRLGRGSLSFQAHALFTLHYIHDPLCGWCYAAAPLLQAAAQLPDCDLRLHGGALWPVPTVLPPELREQIRSADQRIARMTGQTFGRKYHEELLPSDALVLHSAPTLAAVLAAKEIGGRKAEIAMLEAIQRANYVEARHVVRESTLRELAVEIGLDAPAFQDAFARAPVEAHVREARGFMARVGAAGFPAACVETASRGLRAVPPQEFLGQPGAFVQRLRQVAAA